MPSPLELIDKLRRGELRPADLLRYVPDPPRLAPVANQIIDRVMHPAAEKRRELYLVDSALHMLVEMGDQFVASVTKSIRYNLPKMLRGGRGG